MAVPLDHFLSRRNSLSNELILKVFGEEIAKEMEQLTKERYNTSISSSTASSTTSSTQQQQKSVEYGPQLPQGNQSSLQKKNKEDKSITTTTNNNTSYSWGKEPYGSPEFTWFKFLSRTTLELVLVSVLAIIIANGLSTKNKK